MDIKRKLLLSLALSVATVSALAQSAPAITTEPTDKTAASGDTIALTVVATGDPAPTFQWKKGSTNLVDGENAAKTTVSGATTDTLTLTGVHVADSGSYTVTLVNSEGNVTSAPATVTVNKATATVTLGGLAATYDGNSHAATATTTPADLTVGFTYQLGEAAPTATAPTAAGSYAVAATVDDPEYSGTASDTLVIGKASQTITFAALDPIAFGSADFDPGAHSDADLAVTYASDNTDVATIAEGKVHIIAPGTVTITASQAGDDNHAAAVSKPQSLSVTKGDQTITFAALADKPYKAADFTVTASASSGLPVTFASSDESVATINPTTGVVHVLALGSTDITASQAGDDNYNAAVDKKQTLTIVQADQTISFPDISKKMWGDAAFDLNATASSGLEVSYASSNPAVATVAGKTITLVGLGSTTLTATQAGDGNYKAATAVTRVLVINPAIPEITDTPPTKVKAALGSGFAFGPVSLNDHVGTVTFTMSGAPAGLSINPSAGIISGTPTTSNAPGDYTITLTVSNVSGSASETIDLTLGGPLPVITAQPANQAVASGGTATFSVTATGATTYQWKKNGALIAGATSATCSVANVSTAEVGVYSVAVSNENGSVESEPAMLAISANAAPSISKQPVAQTVAVNGSVTLSVGAAGEGLTYQWRRNGVAIAGATEPTLTISEVWADTAGEYTVTITNANGSVTSEPVSLTVRGVAYFGTFAGDAGTFALYVNPDRSGIFLGFAKASNVVLISRDVVVGPDGHFSTTTKAAGAATRSHTFGKPVAAAEVEYAISGSIGSDGSLSGTVSGLDLTLSAPAPTSSGSTADYAGFYQAGAVGSSATTYAIVGPDGEAYMANVTNGVADAGAGAVSTSGEVSVTTAGGASATGNLDSSDTLSVAVTASGGATTTFVGANNEARTDDEKLVNISTRTLVGGGDNVLIAGFVVTGTEPKTLLVRAVGPTLANYSIASPLGAAKLELFQGGTSIKVGADWSTAEDAAAVADAAKRVGAFDLPAGSHDAAMLVTLDPGLYSAVVSGQDGATGVAMVEVYDATVGTIAREQRLTNISSRGNAGTGENVMTAGFAVHGSVPKRVLIRGVGPSLSQYGMTGYVTQPQIKVLSGDTTVLQATGIAAADEPDVAAESLKVGAFPLVAGSGDTAVIVYLSPGTYTVQLSNAAGTTGLAMLELYELP